jgi:hypothetical protein
LTVASLYELLEKCWQLLLVVWGIAWNLVKRHLIWLIASVCIVLLLQLAWLWYDDWRTIRLTMLVGPGGSTAFQPAQKIADRLIQSPGVFGSKFEVELISTSGYEENRRRIEADTTGRLLGFAHDGFGDSEHVQILLPMEWNYCHIICSKDLIKKASRTGSLPDFGPSLGEIATHLVPGRVYLGARESGTRQVAELVFRQYGISPDAYSTHGVADWHEMRSAFKTGQIQLAFYHGTLDSPIVKGLAQDGHTVLLGVNESRDAMVQMNPQLAPLNFAANLYEVNHFCPKQQKSVASRRVLACSSRMPENIGFEVASRAEQAIKGTTELRWDMLPPDDPRRSVEKPFTYSIHPGAKLVRDDQTPSSFVVTWWQTIAVLAVFVLGKIVKALVEWDGASDLKSTARSRKPLKT